jgi:hypothetical protein
LPDLNKLSLEHLEDLRSQLPELVSHPCYLLVLEVLQDRLSQCQRSLEAAQDPLETARHQGECKALRTLLRLGDELKRQLTLAIEAQRDAAQLHNA